MNVHKIWLLLLFLLIPTILFAQKTRTVKGLVCTTSETKKGEEPLPYASLVILEGKDSTFVKGVASDADGRFNLQFTPQKGTQYLLKASYTGMQSVFRKLDSNASTINLGSILLEEGIELGEVTVNARMRDVDQVGDTTVINAAAYKTPEGSYLETLVKRIPGMEYDSETKTLKYNGLPINEINVNGEAFFSGDNKMARGKRTMCSTCKPKKNSMVPFLHREKPDTAITTKRISTCKATTSKITETISQSSPIPVTSICGPATRTTYRRTLP